MFCVKLILFLLQVRYFSSKSSKIIDLSFADIEPVYTPINIEDNILEEDDKIQECSKDTVFPLYVYNLLYNNKIICIYV